MIGCEKLRRLQTKAYLMVAIIVVVGGFFTLIGQANDWYLHKKELEKLIDDGWDKVDTGVKDKEIVGTDGLGDIIEVVDGGDSNEIGKENLTDTIEIEKPKKNRTSVTDELIGVIRADSINLKEPIYMGASELNMRRGVATVGVGEHLNEHTVAIAGHRSPIRYQYFSEVLKLKIGENIVIETKNEKGEKVETEYEVKKTYKVTPEQTDILQADVSKPRTLILITCDEWDSKTKTYNKRWITEASIK